MKKTTPKTAKIPRGFVPYTVELVHMRPKAEPVRHFVYVYSNGVSLVIELHKENPPTRTSQIGFYGVNWTITKVKSDKAITEYTVAFTGGRVTRYNALTRLARKLKRHIPIYELQREQKEKAASQDKKDRNDHYVSQVLLRRFTEKGRLQKYALKYGKWSSSAPRAIFSEIGYNQLLAYDAFNADLDDRLKELEDTLPITLAALDNAANAKETVLDPMIYHRMCLYCAFLWEMSPFCKSAAPVNFVHQLLIDLKNNNTDFLDALGYGDESIEQIKQHYANGSKFIITGKNYLQIVYRLQFSRQLDSLYKGYRHLAKWTVARSPIELPIGDMALIKYHLPDLNIIRSILPISPTLLLMGDIPLGQNLMTSNTSTVYGGELPKEMAESMREVICKAAILTVASKTRFGDVNEWRKKSWFQCTEIYDKEAAFTAGQAPIVSELDFLIKPTDKATFNKWQLSILKPYSLPAT